MKRENKKVNKELLVEVTGARVELKEYVGEQFKVEGFVTNTLGYRGGKRLVSEIYLNNLYLKHCWFSAADIDRLEHGYQLLEVEVIKYQDFITKEFKYGLKYVGAAGKKFPNKEVLKKPKWMLNE